MEEHVVSLASETLGTFDKIESKAKERLAERQGTDLHAGLAITQTFTASKQVEQMAAISSGQIGSLKELMQTPAISRVTVENEEGQLDTYYISRSGSLPIPGIKLAGYKDSPIGRLAARDVGDEVEIQLPEKNVWLTVIEKLQLHPTKLDQEWDSPDTVWYRENEIPQTIHSLRNVLHPPAQDGFAAMLAGASNQQNVIAGLRHQIRQAMALRDQAVLDKFQDDIFRLPLGRQLIILGPPGTGKTTTLIKRLGQKLDWEALDSSERNAMDIATYRSRWIMFTPSDLLKHYLKEAFSREDVPASDDHIKTWSKRRHELARTVFNILKTSTGGIFILKEDRQYCSPGVVTNPCTWFDDFRIFHHNRIIKSLQDGATLLQEVAPDIAKPVVDQLLNIMPDVTSGRILNAYAAMNGLEERFEPLLKDSRKQTDQFIQGQGNLLYNRNNKVFSELAAFLDTLVQGEEEDEEAVFDEDAVEESTQPSQTTEQKAYQAYRKFLQSYARSRYRGRTLGKTSRAARIRDWLGERVPSDDLLKELGGKIAFQNALRRFRLASKRYVLDVPSSYRAFRRHCMATNQHVYSQPESQLHIDMMELDAILLLMLRCARDLIQRDFVRNNLDQPKFTELARIEGHFQYQVLVDEATDFSVLQLACMESLAHPNTRSFFACGDFNQRITGHGLHSLDQLNWISDQIENRRINVVYRQSRKLNAFGGELLKLMGGDLEASGNLPEHSLHEGVSPVLAEHLNEDAVSDWLTARICEIERTVDQQPSIAVLVASEDRVKPMADALNNALGSVNLHAVACVDGQSLGDEMDVRVFNIQHIKGLEFEVVFFVGIDELAITKPELFDRYLYVGATRAATYLGVVCYNNLPSRLSGLRADFVNQW